MVEIAWIANPFRGDKFEAAWAPAAEAVLRYGATEYAFIRSQEDRLRFTQWALFEDRFDFDRYWYSEEISAARAEASGLYQVPLVPVWLGIVEAGQVVTENSRV